MLAKDSNCDRRLGEQRLRGEVGVSRLNCYSAYNLIKSHPVVRQVSPCLCITMLGRMSNSYYYHSILIILIT